MRAYLDCPGCSCLVAVGESACPFCGHAVRSAGAPSWLGLGLVLTLGAATISCGDKGGDAETDDTVTASESQSSQGPDSNGDVSDSTTFPDGATYAGPDETWTTGPLPGTTTEGPGSSSTTVPDPTNAEGSTYAGPDETDSFDSDSDSTTSTSTTTTTESSSGTEGETLGSTGDTDGGSSGTGSSG